MRRIRVRIKIESMDINGNSFFYKYNEKLKNDEKFGDIVKMLVKKYSKINKGKNYYTIYELRDIWLNTKYKKINRRLVVDEKEVYSASLEELDKRFHFFKKTLTLDINTGRGGTTGYYNGIDFVIHTNEKDLHHIPHIHCIYGEWKTRINLYTLEPIDKPFKNKNKMKLATKIVKQNQRLLLDYWDDIVNKGKSYKIKLHIEE